MRAKHPHWDKMAEFSYPVKSFPKHPHNIEGMVILRHFKVLSKDHCLYLFQHKGSVFRPHGVSNSRGNYNRALHPEFRSEQTPLANAI
jgi:hypothetical protein